MAVCWGPGDPATTLVMLDDAGQLSDILFAGQLSGNIRRGRQGDELFADPSKVRLTLCPGFSSVSLSSPSQRFRQPKVLCCCCHAPMRKLDRLWTARLAGTRHMEVWFAYVQEFEPFTH